MRQILKYKTQQTLSRVNIKNHLVIGVVIFCSALSIRYIKLFDLDLWFDEITILLQIDLSFSDIWEFNKSENFPPFYPWLVKLWSYCCHTDNGYRVLNAIIGSLVAPVAYLLGCELKDKKLGTLVGLASAVSVPLIYYSQVVRMYSLFVVFICISYYTFSRAVATEKYKYWIITAIANLLAFYTHLFGLFVITTEFIILIWIFRADLKKMIPPVVSHIPTLILMSFWFLVLLDRYQVVQSYTHSANLFSNLIRLWLFMGSGVFFGKNLIIAFFVNIPLFVGLFLGIPQWFRNRSNKIFAALFVMPFALIVIVSFFRFSIIDGRYLLFLVPSYLTLVISGWLYVNNKLWRSIGLISVFISLIFSSWYYFSNYLEANDTFRYHGVFAHSKEDDGKCYSRIAAIVEGKITSDEVIIHYSGPYRRSFTFFTSIYYHKRSLLEYVYTTDELPYAVGRQYLKPNERITSLNELDQIPGGIWVITLNKPKFLYIEGYKASQNEKKFDKWIEKDNLPAELKGLDYHFAEIIRDGSLSAIHFIR